MLIQVLTICKSMEKRRTGNPAWVKGVSGNPAGKPPGSVSVVAELKRKIQEVPLGQQKTYLQLLVDRLLKKSIADGDISAIKEIINRIDGLPKGLFDFGLDKDTKEFLGYVCLPPLKDNNSKK